MGEDIHIKTYVYSKIDKKYIDALSLTSNPQYSCFKPWFDGRNYDFFALFGSHRSGLSSLNGYTDGIPYFVSKAFAQYVADCQYYGFRWFYATDLMKSMKEYIHKIYHPLEYFEDDEDILQDMVDDKTLQNEWFEEYKFLIPMLEKAISKIQETYDFCASKEIDNLIDPAKTVYLVYFDS